MEFAFSPIVSMALLCVVAFIACHGILDERSFSMTITNHIGAKLCILRVMVGATNSILSLLSLAPKPRQYLYARVRRPRFENLLSYYAYKRVKAVTIIWDFLAPGALH